MNSFIFDPSQQRRPMTADEERKAKLAMALNQPKDVASGLASIGQALAYRAQKNGSFPKSPGGGFMSGLQGLFGLGAKGGGLY